MTSSHTPLLDTIKTPEDLRALPEARLAEVAEDTRLERYACDPSPAETDAIEHTKGASVEGIGVAIPVELVRGVMQEIIAKGRVVRGWIGIRPLDERGLLGDRRPVDLVGARVALGEEPLATAGAVEPPLALNPGDVPAEVVVGAQLAQRGALAGAAADLAAIREVGDFAGPAVGAGQDVRQGGLQLVRCCLVGKSLADSANAFIAGGSLQPCHAR